MGTRIGSPPPPVTPPTTALALRSQAIVLADRVRGVDPLIVSRLLTLTATDPAVRNQLLTDLRIRIAARRLAGETPNPFEGALLRFFPEGTEEGNFLQGLIDQHWRSGERQSGFPETAQEFLQFVKILLGNTFQPIDLRRKVERIWIRTPPPLSAKSAGSATVRKTTPPRPLTPETIDHFDVDVVFHGHAHHGTYEGKTVKGTPVYNCCFQLVQRITPEQPYALVEV